MRDFHSTSSFNIITNNIWNKSYLSQIIHEINHIRLACVAGGLVCVSSARFRGFAAQWFNSKRTPNRQLQWFNSKRTPNRRPASIIQLETHTKPPASFNDSTRNAHQTAGQLQWFNSKRTPNRQLRRLILDLRVISTQCQLLVTLSIKKG